MIARDDGLPRLCILGHSRAGKDTMAEHLAATTPLVHPGSTSLYLLPHYVAWKHGLPLDEVQAGRHDASCVAEYAARHANRLDWYDCGNRLRADDPGLLVRAILSAGHLLVGLRDVREIDYARSGGLVDAFVWVANRRVPPDPTVRFGPETCDLVIENHGDLAGFLCRIDALRRFASIPLSTGRPAGVASTPRCG